MENKRPHRHGVAEQGAALPGPRDRPDKHVMTKSMSFTNPRDSKSDKIGDAVGDGVVGDVVGDRVGLEVVGGLNRSRIWSSGQ